MGNDYCSACGKIGPTDNWIPMAGKKILPSNWDGIQNRRASCQRCFDLQQKITEPKVLRELIEPYWDYQVGRDRCYELCKLTAERMGVPYWQGWDPHFGTKEKSVSLCINGLHHGTSEAGIVLTAELRITDVLLKGKIDHATPIETVYH